MSLPALKFSINTARDVDPTRTIVLRGQFIAQVNKRFEDLKGAITRLLTKENFLEPTKPTEYRPQFSLAILSPGVIPIGLAAKYEYLRSDVKVDQFMDWLKDQEAQDILKITQRPGGLRRGQSQAWSDTYIQSSYQKGIAQARADLRKAGADIPSFQSIPGGVAGVFNQPFHADRVALIYTRAFNEMEGITEAMNGHLSRELALGMAQGQSPYQIARRINEKVDNIGIVRGRLIARTEIVQAHNEAALNEYERAEVEIGEPVKVEWVAVIDDRTRSHHAARNGKVYERSVAREMLGEPNCRCGLAPWIESLQKEVPVKKVSGKLRAESIIGDPKNKKLEKAFFELYDNPKQWEISWGISENNIFIFDGKKQDKIAGWLKFARLKTDKNILTASFDIRKNAKDKSGVLRELFRKFSKEVEKMKGIKYFEAEFATEEGMKAGALIAKKLKLELKTIKTGYQYKKVPVKPVTKIKKFMFAKTMDELNDKMQDMKLGNFAFDKKYSAKDALKAGNQIAEHMYDRFAKFPGMRRLLDKQQLFTFDIVKTRVLLSKTGGAIGIYSRSNFRIELAGSTRKVNSLANFGKSNFAMNSDLFSAARHEFGHHIWPKANTTKFKALWKEKGKSYFETNLTKYAGTDLQEAFCEALSAYTSPLYGTTMKKTLPKLIEEAIEEALK